MTIKKEKDLIRKINWAVFANSYFFIARLACQELLNTQKNSKSMGSDSPYAIADLFAPILFNIKHGIELFIKALSLYAYGDYDHKHHDIDQLFTEAKEKILNLRFTSPPQEFYNTPKEDDINKSIQGLTQIELLVSYFHNLPLLELKIGNNYKIEDIKNDIFRYPENRARIQINWYTILYKITENDIRQVFEKLEEVSKLLNENVYLHMLLDQWRDPLK